MYFVASFPAFSLFLVFVQDVKSHFHHMVFFIAAHRSSSQRYKAPVDDSCEESSIFSSDLDTTSVAESEDDRKSRCVTLCKD